jgi:zinc protease
MSHWARRLLATVAIGAMLSGAAGAQQIPQAPLLNAPAATPAFAISTAPTPGGIQLTHFIIADAKDQILRFVWRDRSAQYQPDNIGVYALATGTMLASGIPGLDGGALQEELNDLNASLSFSRGAAFTIAGFSAPNPEVAAVSTHFGRLIHEPRLSEVQLRRRKNFLINNLAAEDRKPENFSGRILRQASLGAHPLGALNDLEPRDRITSATVQDIESWRRTRLARANLHAFVVGVMSRDDAAAIVDRLAENLPKEAPVEPSIPVASKALTKTVLLIADVQQTQLRLGTPVLWNSYGEEGMARSLATSILGGGSQSRLFAAIRDRLGAAYGASAGFETRSPELGIFSMQASVQHEKALDALAAFHSEYAEFRAKGVKDDEVNPIKLRWQAGFRQSMRNPNSAISGLVNGYTSGEGINTPNRYAAQLASIDAAGINRRITVRMPEKLATIIVAPKDIGFNADCTVRTVKEAVACLAE